MVATIVSNKVATLKSDLRETRRAIERYRAAGISEMDRRMMKERCNEVILVRQISELEGGGNYD